MLASLESLKTMAPFAYDAIKKSTDRILAGTESQFFTVPVENEKIATFWSWFSGCASELEIKLDKKEYDAVMTSVGEQLLETFPFLEQRPTVSIGKNNDGYVILLKDLYAVGIIDAYGKLLAACPETVRAQWLFDVVH